MQIPLEAGIPLPSKNHKSPQVFVNRSGKNDDDDEPFCGTVDLRSAENHVLRRISRRLTIVTFQNSEMRNDFKLLK